MEKNTKRNGMKTKNKTYKFDKAGNYKIILPDFYKPIGQSIIETPKDALSFVCIQDGYTSLISTWMEDTENAFPYDYPQFVIDEFRNTLQDDQGVIEVGNGLTVDERQYIYVINKYRMQEVEGNGYHICMHIDCGKKFLLIQAFFEEFGTTGIREATVYSLLQGQGKVGPDFAGWAADPYDAEYQEGFLMNQSEKEEFDEMFPTHPLSKCRQMRDFFITTSLGRHGGKMHSKEKKESDFAKTEENDTKAPKDKPKREDLDQKLKEATDEYNGAYTVMNDRGVTLYTQRERSVDVIQNVENLINSIANHPKEFDTKISEIIIDRQEFKKVSDYAKEELKDAQKSAVNAGAGVAGGTAIVSLAPSAAMWVATTFGTASTGTAISTLSGAAAQSAALAWLGGGALAAGGGGMAGGTAFLALAGPIGWSVAGASVLVSIVLFANKKMERDKDKKENIKSVLSNTEQVREVDIKIKDLLDKTIQLRDSLSDMYNKCLAWYGMDYESIPDEGQNQLGSLVNQTKSLAALLREGV